MTITQLEYLIEIANHKNFGAAARCCGVTQPTLSMQMQKLEDELGVMIFDRSKQPTIPTKIGLEIIEQARTILRESKRLHELVNNKSKQIKGELILGIIPTISPFFLPLVVHSFLANHPNVRLVIQEMLTEKILESLENEIIDAGILILPEDGKTFQQTTLFYENFVVYASPDLNFKTAPQPDHLCEHKLWLLQDGNCFKTQALSFCSIQKESSGSLIFEGSSLDTLIRLVDKEKNSLALIPEMATLNMRAEQKKQVFYFEKPSPAREISLVTHRHYLKKNLTDAFSAHILTCIPQEMQIKNDKRIIKLG